jgi:hypothetical protein
MKRRIPELGKIPSPFVHGLSPDGLRRVVARGEALRALATSLDAPTRGGSNAYFEKVLGLREWLVPLGWTIDNHKNFCTVLSPDGDHAIAVAQGSLGTGDPKGKPETIKPMGPATQAIVQANVSLQVPLFGDRSPEALLTHRTWLLLTYRESDVVHCELSLPEGFSELGFVCKWEKRHCLAPVDLGPDGSQIVIPRDPTPPDAGDAPSVEVKVRRKR